MRHVTMNEGLVLGLFIIGIGQEDPGYMHVHVALDCSSQQHGCHGSHSNACLCSGICDTVLLLQVRPYTRSLVKGK